MPIEPIRLSTGFRTTREAYNTAPLATGADLGYAHKVLEEYNVVHAGSPGTDRLRVFTDKGPFWVEVPSSWQTADHHRYDGEGWARLQLHRAATLAEFVLQQSIAANGELPDGSFCRLNYEAGVLLIPRRPAREGVREETERDIPLEAYENDRGPEPVVQSGRVGRGLDENGQLYFDMGQRLAWGHATKVLARDSDFHTDGLGYPISTPTDEITVRVPLSTLIQIPASTPQMSLHEKMAPVVRQVVQSRLDTGRGVEGVVWVALPTSCGTLHVPVREQQLLPQSLLGRGAEVLCLAEQLRAARDGAPISVHPTPPHAAPEPMRQGARPPQEPPGK